MGSAISIELHDATFQDMQDGKLQGEERLQILQFARVANENCDEVISQDEYLRYRDMLTLPNAFRYVTQFFSNEGQYCVKVDPPSFYCGKNPYGAVKRIETAQAAQELLDNIGEAFAYRVTATDVNEALGSRVQAALDNMVAVATQVDKADPELLRLFDLECDIAMAAVEEMNFKSEEERNNLQAMLANIFDFNRGLITSSLEEETEALRQETERLM